MLEQGNRKRMLRAGMLAAALVSLCLMVSSASAKLTGDFTVFEQCPVTNPEVIRCFDAEVEGGEITVGKRNVPIVNPMIFQGGVTVPVGGVSSFAPANNGATLTPVSQPVPGGLLGIVPPDKGPSTVKGLVKALLASRLNRVDATIELAGPASSIHLSLTNILIGEGRAVTLPIKVRLENPLFGKNCYIGSNSAPIMLEFTTGSTEPPSPNTSISGDPGSIEFLDEARILRTTGIRLVDNSWSAPKASGCGGNLHSLIDPIVNAQLGLPSAAGHNSAILTSTQTIATPAAVINNDKENP
jgi:hypothetical protein